MSFSKPTGGRRALTYVLAAAALIATAALPARTAVVTPPDRSRRPDVAGDSAKLIAGFRADRVVAPASLYAALAELHNKVPSFSNKVPSFSRQTGLSCSACHYQFPQLTPFGRLFRLNGYTLTHPKTIGEPGGSLALSPIPPFSAMALTSMTRTRKAVPNAQNNTAAFPQSLSVWVAGAVAPKLGLYTQFTYEAVAGSFGIDMIDIRYADHSTLAGRDLLYGVTLHNNPTVQDVWNTVPAWVFPFAGSSSAPSPIASTLIDGTLAQQVVGLGAYSLYNNLLYTEFTVYRSAPQGPAVPLDSSARNVTANPIPYWRVALQHESPSTSLMLGTFGFDAHLYPNGVSGLINHFSDAGIDAQIEQRRGAATWIGRASVIHERQRLMATQSIGGAAKVAQRLTTARASVAYLPTRRYSFTLGYFKTTGTSDPTLYASQPVLGSRTGSPNTAGAIGEITFDAWQNARLGLQFTAYNSFNGTSTSYDIAGGRNASDNNTLYTYLWLLF